MYAETRDSRTPDLRASGAVSLVVHGVLILLVGVAVTHSRAQFTPPTIQMLRLDVDLATPVAAENALAATQLNQLLVIVQLYKALGGGWR